LSGIKEGGTALPFKEQFSCQLLILKRQQWCLNVLTINSNSSEQMRKTYITTLMKLHTKEKGNGKGH
jgi:hypothetical protein